MKKLTVHLKYEPIDGECEGSIIWGGDNSNPTWKEYLNQFSSKWKKYMRLIRKCIKENELLGKTAMEVCNDIYFEFSNGKQISFTFRAWGDLMQAIVNKREGYMVYYG